MARPQALHSLSAPAHADATPEAARSRCRFCRTPLAHVFADLGMSPLANAYLTEEQLGNMERFYPLRALVCERCFLVQLEEFEPPETIFSDYTYFSSYSTTWLEHSEAFAGNAISRFGLTPSSQVVEVASNDGYLLQYFAQRGIPVLGVEPAANVAEVAVEKGVPTVVEFFGRRSAWKLRKTRAADLLIANNVLAHVPDLNDFVGGLELLLAPGGVVTVEFPHLLPLVDEAQFDTIYHEHFSYFSFLSVQRVFAAHGLAIFDVEELPTHGGSLRVYAAHAGDETRRPTERVADLARREEERGYGRLETYLDFGERVRALKRDVVTFFVESKTAGLSIAGYGAPAKGNTLLNYCGIGADFIDYTVDRNPHKQGRFLPGTHIPIRPPDEIARTKPDLLFILPWNWKDEVMEQMRGIRDWGGRFVVRSPELCVY
jgi:SAM-dependent methyltransferase